MADEPEKSEKTEEPTQKKLDDAHKRGDVAKSQEVNSWFVMLGAALFVAVLAPAAVGDLTILLREVIAKAHAIPVDGAGLAGLWHKLGTGMILALLFPFAIFMLAAAAGNLVQHRPVWSVDPITPKLSKISPISGFKRLFSAESLINFLKGLAKIGIVTVMMTVILWSEVDRLDAALGLDPATLMQTVQQLSIKLIGGAIAILTIVAGLDFLWQRHRWHQRQKMTVRELRDEFKQMEGDPMIKAKLRQIRAERSRRRMMQNVPQASVVVTNPTHFAVALKYEAGMAAPVCLAKGIDATALKIREVAEEHDVPVVENPPLARTLHAAVEVDEEIPPEHYKAVAEIIGYVLRLKNRPRWRSS